MRMTAKPSVSEALSIIEAAAPSPAREALPVAGALGRLIAAPAHARIGTPRFAASAMDGFALRGADTIAASPDRPVALRLASPIPAGTWPEPLGAGRAAPIATGAPVPAGADAVIVRERARIDGDTLLIEAPVDAGRNVRASGEDFARGAGIAAAGRVVTPDLIGALVSCGVDRVTVARIPAIAILSTGSELAGSGAALDDPARTIDCNGPMIRAYAEAAGLRATFLGRAADRAAPLDALLAAADDRAAGDIILSTGGVSAGDADLVRERLIARGGVPLFHGVRMRPGKPLLFARLPDGRLYFGLPGNPVAALIGFRFFVLAAVRRMLGLPREAGEPVAADVAAREDTTLFLRARRTIGADGVARMDTGLDQRSHVLASVLAADHWLRVDGDGAGVLAFPKQTPPFGRAIA